jgi:hypothetical protein
LLQNKLNGRNWVGKIDGMVLSFIVVQTAQAHEQKHQPGDAHFSGGVELQLGCFHEGARSGCLTMKLSVDYCLVPFILSC